MNEKGFNDSAFLKILAMSIEHHVEEAAVAVESELCCRCPKDIRKCRKPCLAYQHNFDAAMTRIITLTSPWN